MQALHYCPYSARPVNRLFACFLHPGNLRYCRSARPKQRIGPRSRRRERMARLPDWVSYHEVLSGLPEHPAIRGRRTSPDHTSREKPGALRASSGVDRHPQAWRLETLGCDNGYATRETRPVLEDAGALDGREQPSQATAIRDSDAAEAGREHRDREATSSPARGRRGPGCRCRRPGNPTRQGH